MATARHGLSVGAIGGLLYAAGGYNGSHVGNVEAYDPTANSWSAKASMSAQDDSAFGVSGGALYVTLGNNCCVAVSSGQVYTASSNS
ncbi:MAG: hypothetical protein JOZ39_05780, partial [Chloroflexi bacterium]|nr:hypothetical protein [Chloroflexota bacterium]